MGKYFLKSDFIHILIQLCTSLSSPFSNAFAIWNAKMDLEKLNTYMFLISYNNF